MTGAVTGAPPSLPLPSPRRLIGSLLGLLVAVSVAGALLRGPLEAACGALVARLGAGGLYLATAALDPIPGIGFQGSMVAGSVGGMPFWGLYALLVAGSLTGSVWVWAIGRLLQDARWLQRILLSSGVRALLERFGWRAIAAAAVLPVPYGLVTLGAGARGVPLRALLRGACCRAAKILVFQAVWCLGWSHTG